MPDVGPVDIAVVGIGSRFPPDTTGPEGFLSFLRGRGVSPPWARYLQVAGGGRCSTTRTPSSRDAWTWLAGHLYRSAVDLSLAELRRAGVPIGGVVHAAGVVHDLPVGELSAADLRLVVAPKLLGAHHLHHATLNDPIDLFLLTSSVASLTGTSGQAAYTAANSAIEAFAQWRRRQGRPATAVALGPVAEVGMAAQSEEVDRYVRLYGFEPLPPDRLGEVFDRVVEWNRPVLGVFDIDWGRWQNAEPRAAASRRFAAFAAEARSGAGGGGDSWARLVALPEAGRVQALAGVMAGSLAAILDTSPADIGPDTALETLGLDSLVLIELQTYLNDTLGADMSLMGLVGADTVLDAAERLERKLTNAQA